MRVLELRSLEGPDGLELADRPEPDPDGGFLIEVHVAGASFPDLLMSKGSYQVTPKLPAVLGLEVAGIVSVAPDDHPIRPGDRVWASLEGGGFAERVAARVGQVFPLPEELSFSEGAALPVNYLTAVFALRRRGGLKAGETAVVLGAGGGLGSALVGVADAIGAEVIAVTSTEEKAAIARDAGARHVVVGSEWRQEVLEVTRGRGAEVVADVVGGPQTLAAVRASAPEGRVLVLGFSSGEIPSVAANRLLLRNVSLVGAGLGALVPIVPDLLEECAAELGGLVDSGLRPVVGEVLPLAEGAEALRALEERRACGKLVLDVRGSEARRDDPAQPG